MLAALETHFCKLLLWSSSEAGPPLLLLRLFSADLRCVFLPGERIAAPRTGGPGAAVLDSGTQETASRHGIGGHLEEGKSAIFKNLLSCPRARGEREGAAAKQRNTRGWQRYFPIAHAQVQRVGRENAERGAWRATLAESRGRRVTERDHNCSSFTRTPFSCSGGSHSDCVILNERGERVGASTGPGTNPWIIGFDAAVKELVAMVAKAKRDAGIPEETPLESLVSLSLSLSSASCERGREWL